MLYIHLAETHNITEQTQSLESGLYLEIMQSYFVNGIIDNGEAFYAAIASRFKTSMI